ncbi:hypothetical protein HPULCUR_001657 [Helicostylum pulchrum]|uniref:RRM domain-containing protein n=1 Tax=Helicostylum pulchrum TaxID=562976 RepID=A0ABP9XNC3_9FUNG
MTEMTEPNGNDTANTKKSVVDDFFSALFANNTAASSTPANNSEAYEHKDSQASNQEYKAEIQDYKYNYTADANIKNNNNNDDDEQQDNFNSASEEGRTGARKRERVLDEFDEYSLLSKRRGSDNRNKINVNNRRKPTEAREIQDSSNEIDNLKLDRQILSKRDIDWSTVKPESRMLVRQLPKFIDKQDVMNYFSKYGEVLEVVQKTPFGFVHFENPEACAQAVQIENGKPFHGIVLGKLKKNYPFCCFFFSLYNSIC